MGWVIFIFYLIICWAITSNAIEGLTKLWYFPVFLLTFLSFGILGFALNKLIFDRMRARKEFKKLLYWYGLTEDDVVNNFDNIEEIMTKYRKEHWEEYSTRREKTMMLDLEIKKVAT